MSPLLWEYTSRQIQSGLRRIADEADDEIYVVAIFLHSAVVFDPRWSTLQLLWSTEENYRTELRDGQIDPDDARWSTGGWFRATTLIWDPNDDPAGHAALEQWARDENLWYDGPVPGADDEQIEREIVLFDEIVDGLIMTIRDLHDCGVIQAVFGRPLPVILLPQDSHESYPEWNQQANPPELYAQFGPYHESIWSPG
jgi:hypothetical protein